MSLCEPGHTTLDPERLCKMQPLLKPLLSPGLTWTFIPYWVEELYDKLPFLIQKSLNTAHHVGEGTYITPLV